MKVKLLNFSKTNQLLLLDILDFLVDKGNMNIWSSISSRKFFQSLLDLLRTKDIPEVQMKLLGLIQKWGLNFEDKKSALPNFYGVYNKLRNSNVQFPNDFESLKLMELHDCLVANDNFKHLKDKVINKKELEHLPLLVLTKGATTRIRLDDYCVENNITIHPEMEFGSNTLIKEFTEAGFGIGMLTKEHVKKELESGELFELKIDLPLKEKYLGMVYDSSKKSNIIISNFIKFIKKNIDTN